MNTNELIALLENEIETFVTEKGIGQRYANDHEEGYIEGLRKAIELLRDAE